MQCGQNIATANRGSSKTWDFVKLRPWQLIKYRSIIFLDADMVVRGAGIENLFNTSAFTYSDGPFAPLNAGLFVLKPSAATFDALLNVAREGDFTYENGWRGAGLPNGTAADTKRYKNHASETMQGLLYYWCRRGVLTFLEAGDGVRDPRPRCSRRFVQRKKSEVTRVPREVYNWQVPSDRHDVSSLAGARLCHFTHCGKPPAKVNRRWDACVQLHREWREAWARVLAASGAAEGDESGDE